MGYETTLAGWFRLLVIGCGASVGLGGSREPCRAWDEGAGLMDPVSLVVAALVAGAAKGVGQTAAGAVQDAYGSLKSKVRSLLGGGASTDVVLAEHEEDPQTYEAPLRKKLEAVGVADLDAGDDILVAAQRVLTAADPEGARAGRYVVGSISADRGGVAAVTIEGDVTAGYHGPGAGASGSDQN